MVGETVGVETGTSKGDVTGRELCGGAIGGCGMTGDAIGAAVDTSLGVAIGTAEEDATGAVAAAVGGITSKVGEEKLGGTTAGEAADDKGGREGAVIDITGESGMSAGVFSMGEAGGMICSVVVVSTVNSEGCPVGDTLVKLSPLSISSTIFPSLSNVKLRR